MIGWLIFAVVVIAIVGWRVVGPPRRAGEAGFFRRRQAEAKRRGEKEVDRAYEAYYSDPVNIQWQKQTQEEFKMLMRW